MKDHGMSFVNRSVRALTVLFVSGVLLLGCSNVASRPAQSVPAPAAQETSNQVNENSTDETFELSLTRTPKAQEDKQEKQQKKQEKKQQEKSKEITEDGQYHDLESVVLYYDKFRKLPSNFITKKEARDLGWEGGSVEEFKKGAAIGGDHFGNFEKLLPAQKGIKYIECDIDTKGKKRGAKRLIISNDGKYYYTPDHYESFEEVVIRDGKAVILK